MTGGGPATATTGIGGAFTAVVGYIVGENLKLELEQAGLCSAWRTTEFTDGDADSEIDVQPGGGEWNEDYVAPLEYSGGAQQQG